MNWLIPLAAKSFLIAGGALLLLKLMKNRSAFDRSLIAHLALGGLFLLPIAAVALPTLDVAGPEFLVGKAEVTSPTPALPSVAAAPRTNDGASISAVDDGSDGGAAVDWPFWGYAVPASVLVLFTLVALGRLVVLKSRANVLVDAPWLTALARAQKRMGFKHGTALLTSNALPSPISWGVVRPVILLNTEAAESHDEAEAIITHELAHVANLDWAKLLLARVAVAFFWFNPFVWLLAREAHQLREEAADDAVLATDIDETEYARLLVGVARHECRGFLIGAHGVAPAKNSLARRVKRVLDNAVKRAPGGWRWGSAAAFFAAGMAVPVAALNLVPATAATTPVAELQAAQAQAGDEARIASAPEAATSSAATDPVSSVSVASNGDTVLTNGKGTIVSKNGKTVLTGQNGSTITVYPPDSSGKRRTVMVGANGSKMAFADIAAVPGLATAIAVAPAPPATPAHTNNAIDRAIELKAVGVTPDYIAAVRAAAPQIDFDHDDIVGMRAVGVTPAFIRELARVGYRDIDADDITGAYAVGIREDYIRSMSAAGLGRISLEDLTELRAAGVKPSDVQRYKQAGFNHIDVEKIVELRTLGITPEELKASQRYGP